MKIEISSKKRRDRKVRKSVGNGTKDKPRLSVFRSNKHIYVQAIDDVNQVTIASSSSLQNEKIKGASKTKTAETVGQRMGKELSTKKIEKAVFDRGPYRYHGRVRIIAEEIRKSGISL